MKTKEDVSYLYRYECEDCNHIWYSDISDEIECPECDGRIISVFGNIKDEEGLFKNNSELKKFKR